MAHSNNPPNNLINEHSPYLLQHAYNPVEWQPWRAEAWQQAQAENKLVLVSIGYSACHWCHVMEKESFEDFETAEIMNLNLVNIKVDREERPDVDMVYMDACQLMTGRGGWPLNVICLPDGRPVYAGTYFPKAQWQQLIAQLGEGYKNTPENFADYATKFMEDLRKMSQKSNETGDVLRKSQIPHVFETFAKDVDWEHGGMNRAPKFMIPTLLEMALDYQLIAQDPVSKEFLHLTLLKMANSGTYDTLRGGFFRYSTDGQWFAPHFEKMLYDNAQLISVYSRAYAWSEADIYKSIAQQSLDFCLRELRHPNGLFYAALDADSEGIEGRYYVFTHEELTATLNDDEFALATTLYGINAEGNWEHGFNILHTVKAPLEILQTLQWDAYTYQQNLGSLKLKLKTLQDGRPRPGLDHKMIVSWNGLMLKALCDVAIYLQEPQAVAAAEQLASTLWNQAWNSETQQLCRIATENSAYGTGFLEDYASFSLGLLRLFDATQNTRYIEQANQLIDAAIEAFYRSDSGQLVFTPNHGEQLILEKSDNTDDVIPSPNALFCQSLLNLFVHRSEPKLMSIAQKLIEEQSLNVKQFPQWYSLWTRLQFQLGLGMTHVSIPNQVSLSEKWEFLRHQPSWVLIGYHNPISNAEWLNHPTTDTSIYVCIGNECLEPVANLQQADEIIQDYWSFEG